MSTVCDAFIKAANPFGTLLARRIHGIMLVTEYNVAERSGGGPYGLIHVVDCLRVFKKLKAASTILEEDDLTAIELALYFAWAKKTRRASALWARSQLSELTGNAMPELAKQVQQLILTVRGEVTAATASERFIAQVGLLADEIKH